MEACGQCLNSTGYFALSHKENSISTGSHFFSYFLLVNKLYKLNAFKLQNIFQTFEKFGWEDTVKQQPRGPS